MRFKCILTLAALALSSQAFAARCETPLLLGLELKDFAITKARPDGNDGWLYEMYPRQQGRILTPQQGFIVRLATVFPEFFANYGIRALPNEGLEYPDTDALNARTAALRQRTGRRNIGLFTFYSLAGTRELDSVSYARDLVLHRMVIAQAGSNPTAGDLHTHDVRAHLPAALLFPVEFLDRLNSRLSHLLALYDDPTASPKAREELEDQIAKHVHSFDLGTALLGSHASAGSVGGIASALRSLRLDLTEDDISRAANEILERLRTADGTISSPRAAPQPSPEGPKP